MHDPDIQERLDRVDRDIVVLMTQINQIGHRFSALEFITERFIATRLSASSNVDAETFLTQTLALMKSDGVPEVEQAISVRLRAIARRLQALRDGGE